MLLTESGLFPAGREADAEKIRIHLILNRTAAELQLIQTWRRSGHYDELSEIETLRVLDLQNTFPNNNIQIMINLWIWIDCIKTTNIFINLKL